MKNKMLFVFLMIMCFAAAACTPGEKQEDFRTDARMESVTESDMGESAVQKDEKPDSTGNEGGPIDERSMEPDSAEKEPFWTKEYTENLILSRGMVGERDYSLTLNLEKWEGYTSEEQLEIILELFWEAYPRMYERFGILSDAPRDVVIAIEAEGYEIAWTTGSFIHLRDEWLWENPEDYDCLTHELAHVIQNGWEEAYLEYGAYIERFADYCRFIYAFQNGRYNDACWTLQTVDEEASREESVRFLVWLDKTYGNEKDLMKTCFQICYDREYEAEQWHLAWETIFQGTELEGKDIEEVWKEFEESEFARKRDGLRDEMTK